MANRNVDKGREAENAAAAVFAANGMPHCERRTKRGGLAIIPCGDCGGDGYGPDFNPAPGSCPECGGAGSLRVPADAGDLTGIPGLVVQVKWSAYKPLAEDMRRTDEQRRVAGADIGLLVRKRKGVGCARAGEWDAYLPTWAVRELMECNDCPGSRLYRMPNDGVWHTDLTTAARLLAHAGYGTPVEVGA